jgi:hypothetical protein
MMARRSANWVWREVTWPRPFDPESALQLLSLLSADHSLGTIVWEARSHKRGVRYLIGCTPEHARGVEQMLIALVGGLRLSAKTRRPPIKTAAQVRVSHHSLALSTDRIMACVRSVLAGLATAKPEHEELVLQVILGRRIAPSMLSDRPSDPRARWFEVILGTVQPASAETKASMKARTSVHGFSCIIRLGATANTEGRERYLISNLFGGLKVAESAGAHLRLSPESPEALNTARRPWRWPLSLSAPELVSLMGWPIGEGTLPGVVGVHPKMLPPAAGLRDSERAFAISSAAGETVKLGVSIKDSLQHTVLLGPTGTGKSNAMLSIIVADIAAGRGVLLIDPKSDLTRDVLARIPESRRRDVVVIDPADPCPVGLNPLVGRHQNPALVADSVLAVFKELFADSWGPRTQDILTSALLTLALYPNSSLVWLPTLLTDAKFRRKLTSGITDRVGLGPFWAAYEAMSEAQRAQAIAPVMNKLRQFLLRPALRSVLGQTEPLFEMNDLFTKRRIVLVSLNKGLIGSEGARLLGSLVVAQLWPLILARASLPPERRHIVSVFIDEVQDYLALPTDLADALSQARGLGVGFTLAHQYRNQLPPMLRAGVDANARNKIVFGLNAGDAHDVAAMAPGLEASDFMLLPRYGIYAHLMNGGASTGWVSGQTLPASTAISDPADLKAASAQAFGRPTDQVEAEVMEAIGLTTVDTAPYQDAGQVGRRRRQS